MVVGQLEDALDFVVVGGGPGGYAAALRAAQLGRRVTLIDRDGAKGVGGVCLRVGCIPSKALIETADTAARVREAATFGVDATLNGIDMKRFQAWKSEVVQGLTDGVRGLLRAAEVEIAAGPFRFTGPDKGVIDSPEGGARFVHFEDLVLATGSRPAALEALPVDGKRVLDSTMALDLDRVPKTVAVVGGGYIGLELGTALAKLGARVAIVEAEERLLPAMDALLARPVARRLEALGVEVLTSTRAKGHARARLAVETPEGERGVAAEVVIVAVGRVPNTDDIELSAAGIEAGPRGLLAVAPDRRLAHHVAAIGDITPGPALAHKATAEALVAAEALCGRKVGFDPQAIPAVVFSDPEVATAGLSLDGAEAAGIDAHAATFPVTASGRAKTLGVREGFLQIVADRADDRVIGVHAVGPHASDIIAEGVLAIEMAATLEDVALTIHAHPTLSEQMGEAAHLGLGTPIHVALGKRR